MSDTEKKNPPVVIFALLTGENLIGHVVNADDYTFTVRNPLSLFFSMDEGMKNASVKTVPYNPFMGSEVSIVMSACATVSNPLKDDDQIKVKYEKMVSGVPEIATPTKELILGNK